MRSKTIIKKIFHWLSRRSVFFVATLLFAIVIILLWLLFTGYSYNNESIIIGIAAISAFLSAISAVSTLLQAVETQKQRENIERPYIISYFDSYSSGAVYFVIENSGNSPALNISFKFNPSPVDYAGRLISEISLFSNPISFLPQGKVIRQIIDASYKLLEDGKPLKFEISTTYYSVFGDSFNEKIDHDLEYLKQVTLPIKTADEYLKDISKEISELTRLIRNAQGLNSFLIESPKEHSTRLNKLRNSKSDHQGIVKGVKIFLEWILDKIIGN